VGKKTPTKCHVYFGYLLFWMETPKSEKENPAAAQKRRVSMKFGAWVA